MAFSFTCCVQKYILSTSLTVLIFNISLKTKSVQKKSVTVHWNGCKSVLVYSKRPNVEPTCHYWTWMKSRQYNYLHVNFKIYSQKRQLCVGKQRLIVICKFASSERRVDFFMKRSTWGWPFLDSNGGLFVTRRELPKWWNQGCFMTFWGIFFHTR